MHPFILLTALSGLAAPVPPPVSDSGLPTPPQQNKPWTPPKSEVPEGFTTNAAKLFDLGFADPRGCEYRSVTLTSGQANSEWRTGTKTHAWLIPANPNAGRAAVCWDGLAYFVSDIGPAADLAADVRAAVKRHTEAVGDDNPAASDRRFSLQFHYLHSHKHDDWLSDEAVALLLRLGEGKLASDLWSASRSPEKSLDQVWVLKLFDRGLYAHLNGNDVIARATLEMLATANEALGEQASAPGEKRDRGILPTEYARELVLILADQRRRATTDRKPIVCIGPGRHRDPAVRIAALIERLEEARGIQYGFPGGVDWWSDVVVGALIREGDGAVEPLLKCYESDTRLTRSHWMNRPWIRPGEIQGVSEAAESVLRESDCYPTSSGDSAPGLTGKALTDAIRTRLTAPESKLPRPERWFRRLADDAAGPDEWSVAAKTLASTERQFFSMAILRGRWEDRFFGGARDESDKKFVGEPLRGKSKPSVSDLIVKRAGQMPNVEGAAELTFALAEWDLAAAKPLLAPLATRARNAGRTDLFVKLLQHAVKAGDATALDKYAEWVSQLTPKDFDPFHDPFDLMLAHPDHPAVKLAAQQLFGSAQSPWRQSFRSVERDSQSHNLSNYWCTSMLRFSGFRATILDLLTDKSEAGTVKIHNSQQMTVYAVGASMGTNLESADAPVGYEGTIRVCDYVGYCFADQVGAAPRFGLYWPEAKRDAALKECASFIQAYGSCVGGPRFDAGGMTFPSRDRPATRAEVERHEAIFSLEADGRSRVVKLPRLPMAANWITLRDIPVPAELDEDGKPKPGTRYLQAGFVWQAEEVQVDGKWQRYFGFAGAHRIAKVAGAEIEFPVERWDNRWLRYAGKLEARLAPPKGTIDPDEPGPPRRILGVPVPVALLVRNAGGLPTDLPEFAGRLVVRAEYSPEVIAPKGMLAPAAKSDASWQGLPARPGASFPGVTGRSLEASAEATVGEIDLAKLFDLSRPGIYRVCLTPKDHADESVEPIIFSLGTPPRP